ncbi:cell wall anchor protein (plasmid) [Lactococcus lactis subsp. lactis]|uniref:Cell wall anchor protein n=1 Tax=Lactococcus lactis subsp. lactis TaxID=1360 RepID=A0A2Z3KRX7_LACLL|nr:prealbumin-like fold domain-containing protein [Lactococcus lactis]AWN67103.1 cell wall anchor protein [Lactococcus lactis subsp. lactis]
MSKKRKLNSDIEQSTKRTVGGRSWKSGKRMFYSAAVLGILVGGGALVSSNLPTIMTHVQAATSMPSTFNQIGSIGSAPLFETAQTKWDNIQLGVDALAKSSNAEYYVGAKSKEGKGQAIGWYNGQTTYNGTSLGSLKGADPADLSQPNYNFVHKAMMTDADGFQDSDNFNMVSSSGEYVGIHNVGQAYQVSTGKYIPIGLKVTINDAKYYDSNEATTPKDVFGDGYKLLVSSRNDGRGNITLGYVVVMTGVPAVDNGGGGEGGGNGGSGETYGGATTGIPQSIQAVITYVNEDTGEVLPDKSLSVAKIADVDAGQAAELGDNSLGYIVSKPTNIELKDNVLTAKTNATVNQDADTLDANSFIAVKMNNSFSLTYTDTLGNNNQGSIIEALFGSQSATAPEPMGYLQLDKTTVQYGDDLPNNLYDFTDLKFQVLDKDKKVVETLTLDKDGKSPKSKALPAGDYTLHEISDKWSNTGQTERPDVKVTVKSGETTMVSGDKLANTAVQGQISITKAGVESGDDMWNGNYTLAGNQFKITSLTDGKTYTITTDDKGKAKTDKIPLGKYKIEEVKAADGFVNTFKPVEVELTYKDQNTEVVFGDAKGTNQEVKGQNKVGKEDAETGKDQDGQGVMKTAKYGYFYNDTSTGSSPHKVGDPVKWTDKPSPKLLEGTKATSAIINGQKVDFGDNVVIDVDDESLEAAVGNLASGKYYSQELDAGEGYTVDATKHEFEIKKKDDSTSNIVTADATSKEQLIKAKVSIHKQTENDGGSTNSGYNGVEFKAEPINGTKADPVTFTTGIDPVTGEDGFASALLAYGQWKITETKGIPGHDDIKPIYIRMKHDVEKDLLTVESSNYEDFHVLISSRTFNVTDNSSEENPNDEGLIIAGNVDSKNPNAPLSPMTYTDKETPDVPEEPEVPSIDIEKSNDTVPKAGDGNDKDKDNNVENDHDTEDTALIVEKNKVTAIKGTITNNGTDALTKIKFEDKLLNGSVSVKDLTWTYKGKKLSTDKDGYFTLDGKLLVLQPKEQIFETSGTLAALPDNELHGDQFGVSAVGVKSGKNVQDHDKFYAKRKAVAPTPAPASPIKKITNILLPKTGDSKSIMTALGAWIVIVATITGGVVLNERKRHTLAMAYHKIMRKIRK